MLLRIMISYSWSNSAERAAIATHLDSIGGLLTLYDRKNIRPGNPIHGRVSDLLDEADFVVAILTQEALKSKEVLDELVRAHERGKSIVPIVSEDVESSLIPAFIRDHAWISYDKRNIDQVLEALSTYLKAAANELKNQVTGLGTATKETQQSAALSRKGKNEVELKFESTANIQFKFSALESAESVLLKVRALCDLLDIEVKEERASEIVDDYFDDTVPSLGRNACSFRRRDQDELHLVTLKSHRGLSWLAALKRGEAEFQCSDDRFRQLLNKPGELSKEFKDRLGIDIECGPLSKVLTVKTKRTKLNLQTEIGQYKFSHDRFYYIYRSTKEEEYSEYNAEIEIEVKGEDERYDPQLEKLRLGISSLLLYTPHQKSKFQRGLEWLLRRKRKAQNFSVMCFGILDFGGRTTVTQKQQIQILNHHCKNAIKGALGEDYSSSVIYLGFGDGMTVVFEKPPRDIVGLVTTVQKMVRADIERKDVEGFEFRVGIHRGPIFKYSDVNESLSYAGSGISEAYELMSLGRAWHIIASTVIHNTALRSEGASGFHRLRSTRGKTTGQTRVFNIYGPGFGSCVPPEGFHSEEGTKKRVRKEVPQD